MSFGISSFGSNPFGSSGQLGDNALNFTGTVSVVFTTSQPTLVVTEDFAGTIATVFTTASPHLALDILFTGTIDSAFTTAGLIDAGGVPSGTIASIFTTTAALDIERPLTGSIASSFWTTGRLVATGGFSGDIISSFTTTGSVKLTNLATGSIDPVFTTSGAFASEGDFTGTISGIFATTAELDISRAFSSTIASVFTTLGRFYTEGSILSGTINSQFSTEGYLHYTIAQSGTIATVFTTTGESKITLPIEGTISPVFVTAGLLRFGKDATGSMAVVFSTSATNTNSKRISGDSASSFTTTGVVDYAPPSGSIDSVFTTYSLMDLQESVESISTFDIKGSGLENEELYRFFLTKGGPGLMQGDLVVSRLGDFPAGSEASVDVHDVRGVVTGVSEEGEVDVKVTAGADKIKDYGQDLVFVQVGSTNNTSRDSLIEIMQDDANAPYIQIRDGINSFTKFDDKSESVIFRAGVLTGLTHPTLGALTGKGTYVAGQGYFTGAVHVGTAGDTYDTDTNTWTKSGTGVYIGPEGNFRAGEAGGDGIEWDNDAKTLNISAVEFKITATDMIVDGTDPAKIVIGTDAANITYTANEGIWMGKVSTGVYGMRIGGHAGAASGYRQRFVYGDTGLAIYDPQGNAIFTATDTEAMKIAGWEATTNSFQSSGGTVGLSTGTYAFWAGNSTPANAEAWIQSDGSAKFTDVIIEGTSQVGAAVLTGIDNIPLIDVVFSGTPNTINWSAGSVVYAGQTYDIDAGNSTSLYLLWSPDSGVSHDGNGFDTQNNVPITGGDVYLLAYIDDTGLVHTSTFLNVIYADLINVTTLSSLNANVGILTAGLIRSGDASSYMDLDATGTDPFLVVDGGAGATLYFDGSGDLADGNISWTAAGAVSISGSITLTNTITSDDIFDVNAYTTNQDRIKLSQMAASYPDTPAGSGLFMDSTHIGFYGDGAWSVYIGNDGTWKLYGDEYNYLQFLSGNFDLRADTFNLKTSLKDIVTDVNGHVGTVTVFTNGTHSFADGDTVVISEVLGMTDLNGTWVIFNAIDDEFEVSCNTSQTWTYGSGAMRNLTIGLEITNNATVSVDRGIKIWDTANPKFFMGDTTSSMDWNVTTANALTIIGGTITGGTIQTSVAGSDRIVITGDELIFVDSVDIAVGRIYPNGATQEVFMNGAFAIDGFLTVSNTIDALYCKVSGQLLFGTSGDVNLFREDANTLKTNDIMDAVGGFAVDGSPGLDQSMTIDGHSLTFTGGILTSYGVV